MRSNPTDCNITKTVAVLGHPAHELRVFGWFQQWRPSTILLTDGSGSSEGSRTSHTITNLLAAGLNKKQLHLGITCPDKQLYRAILEKNLSFFRQRFDFIVQTIREKNPSIVVCDGLEFYNSTHDLCRELTRAAVEFVNRKNHRAIECYEIPLVGLLPENDSDKILKVSPETFDRKIELARNYHQLEHPSVTLALQDLIDRYGIESFQEERICKVPPLGNGLSQPEKVPFYEQFGLQRVEEGIYDQVIRWEKDIKPIFQAIHRWGVGDETFQCAC